MSPTMVCVYALSPNHSLAIAKTFSAKQVRAGVALVADNHVVSAYTEVIFFCCLIKFKVTVTQMGPASFSECIHLLSRHRLKTARALSMFWLNTSRASIPQMVVATGKLIA